MDPNPLFRESDLSFMLREVFEVEQLCALKPFAHLDLETFELYIDAARTLARARLYPLYREMDQQPPAFDGARVTTHPKMAECYDQLADLGVLSATRPEEVGGASFPQTIATVANLYLMAANAGAAGFPLLTAGAAHLVEAFGDEETRAMFMRPMYDGAWTGTMALTEPHAGSSLAAITTRARPRPDGRYEIHGSKIFISGGDHDIRPNVVHMTLARIEGAPEGTKGVSLFAIPRLRPEGDTIVPNDVHTTQLIHKIGWKALPSVALNYGERDDCIGWLIGEPGAGLSYMFQMMNEARLMVGANGIATASAAYFAALDYAKGRRQGRALSRSSGQASVAIIEHPDVRRMLLRQKAIVEGGTALLIQTGLYADHATAAGDEDGGRAAGILDLLTPIAKSFPAEWGFESNSLALQIFGGYGYTTEYMPEAWLRDQRLNSIHEGTSGIQGLDLLGRKVVARGGDPFRALLEEIHTTTRKARAHEELQDHAAALMATCDRLASTTASLATRGSGGDVVGMLAHSDSYLRSVSVTLVAWMWLKMACVAVTRDPSEFRSGKLHACDYWFQDELPRVTCWLASCERPAPSFVSVLPDSF